MKWIYDKVISDEGKAHKIWQSMLDWGFISRADNNNVFEPSTEFLYRFFEDRDDLASNMLRPWKGGVGGALEVSAYLINLIIEKASSSDLLEQLIWEVSRLEKVELNFSSIQEAYWFFLNTYQTMYIHWYLKHFKNQQENGEESSLFSNLKSFVWNKKKSNRPFFYCVGGLNFTIDELKHGVLRGNRKKPGAILRTLGGYDNRSQFISEDYFDQRILFLCLDLPQAMEHIECFDDPDTIDDKLNYYMREYMNVKIELDTLKIKNKLLNINLFYIISSLFVLFFFFNNNIYNKIIIFFNWLRYIVHSMKKLLFLQYLKPTTLILVGQMNEF